MTTARAIITGTLTFGLNKLSPGEPIDPDLAAVCLNALNFVADEMNGGKAFLFREILTAGTVTAATGLLGTNWATLAPGDRIEGATVRYGTAEDVPLDPLTMAQYQDISNKTTPGVPSCYACDGLATLYFYPVPTSNSITLRTKQVVSDFADLDTDYSMPNGFKAALAALLAKKMAPVLVGGISREVASAASNAESQIYGQTVSPAILDVGSGRRANIITGY